MANSNRHRKKDRRGRQQRAGESGARARRIAEAVRREELWGECFDPGTAPERAAEIFLELGGLYPRLGVVSSLKAATSVGHAKAVVAAVHKQAPDSLWALCLALDLALHTGQEAEAALMARAVLTVDPSRVNVGALALRWALAGEPLPAAELLWDLAAEDPFDEDLATDLGLIIDGEQASPVVDRFMDRSHLYAARDAALATARRPGWEDEIENTVAEWLIAAGAEIHEEARAWQTMAFEHSVLRVGDDDSAVGFLEVVAADAGPAAAAALRDWASTVRYGLWQVSDVRYGPGLWLTDVVTGTERYVAMPPEQREGLARWAVLLGAVACIRGVWMPLSGFVPLAPLDAERAFLRVEEAVHRLEDRSARVRRRPRSRSRVNTVLPPEPEAWGPEAASVASTVIGATMPAILREQLDDPGVRLQTTDGEHMVVSTLVLELDASITQLVAEHPDLDEAEDGFVLHGAPVPAEHVAAALAAAGIDPSDLADDGPPRILRAHVARDGARWKATVTSADRERALLEVLAPAHPRIIERTSIDPEQDMILPRRTLTPAFGQSWIDEPHPQLDGLSPRQAVDDDDLALVVELLLRIAEHDSYLRGEPIDLFQLREELGILD